MKKQARAAWRAVDDVIGYILGLEDDTKRLEDLLMRSRVWIHSLCSEFDTKSLRDMNAEPMNLKRELDIEAARIKRTRILEANQRINKDRRFKRPA